MKQAILHPAEKLIREMVAFSQARFEQYRKRTGQSHKQATNTILATYGKDKNEAAVRALVDPFVDPEYRSDVADRMSQERQAYAATLRKERETRLQPD